MRRISLIGAGFIGTVHAGNLASHPGVDFVSVYDPDRSRAGAVASRFGASLAGCVDEALHGVDAVYIASSTDTHAELLRAAVDSGVAVLIEKPIDLDLARASGAAAHARGRGVPVMVNFNRRFDRDHAELRRRCQRGDIGAVELLSLSSRGPEVPPLSYIEVSGGQFRDQAVHFYDLARWITGEDPVSVTAVGSALASPELARYGDVDTSVSLLRLPSGGLVQVDCMRRTGHGYDERIEAVGSLGLVESGRMPTDNVRLYRGGEQVTGGLHPGWFERVRPTYAEALDHFVRALEGDHPMTPGLDDGLKAQAIAEAATASLRSGRTEPVHYPG